MGIYAMFQVGLTGNIGAGKTTAGKYFSQLGITVIEADLVAKNILDKHIDLITTHFGQAVCTKQGQINTDHLKQCIFNNPKEKIWLENIIHPETRHAILQQQQASTSRYTVTILPLLDKKNCALYQFDHICLVSASYQKKSSRVQERDHISETLFTQIIQSQPKEIELNMLADTTIDNNGDILALEEQVKKINATLINLSKQKKT